VFIGVAEDADGGRDGPTISSVHRVPSGFVGNHRGQRAGLGTGVGLSAHRPRVERPGHGCSAQTVGAHDERRTTAYPETSRILIRIRRPRERRHWRWRSPARHPCALYDQGHGGGGRRPVYARFRACWRNGN